MECMADGFRTCGDACGALARAFVRTSEGRDRRFPMFEKVDVRVAEPKMLVYTFGGVVESSMQEKVAMIRDTFEIFEMAGIEVGIQVIKTDTAMI